MKKSGKGIAFLAVVLVASLAINYFFVRPLFRTREQLVSVAPVDYPDTAIHANARKGDNYKYKKSDSLIVNYRDKDLIRLDTIREMSTMIKAETKMDKKSTNNGHNEWYAESYRYAKTNVRIDSTVVETPKSVMGKDDLKETVDGLIGKEIPDTMTVGEMSEVKIFLTQSHDTTIITAQLPDKEKKRINVELISLTSVASVHLIDPSGNKNFFIVSDTSNTLQPVGLDSKTTWLFYVTPLTAGRDSLVINVSVRIKKDGSELYKQNVVYNKGILIHANYPYTIKEFTTTNWKWLMTSIIIPVIAYFWKKRDKNKEAGS